MFAARRIATSILPRVALTASIRPTVAPSSAATARKAFANTSIARFLNTNAIEQKRATVQRKPAILALSKQIDVHCANLFDPNTRSRSSMVS